jgi:phage shock protein A
MTDLFKKLNVLIKAGLNDILPETSDPSRRDQPIRLGKDIDREVGALRQRINEAVQYEEKLQTNARVLREEIARWDQQADEAVQRGNDAAARHAIDQMKRAEQRLEMAEADLRDHQLVTEDLIRRVNALEAVVADARRQQEQQAAPAADAAPVQAISDVLRSAREKISEMGDMLAARDEVNQQTTPPSMQAADEAAESTVEDDLARRRQRLSKP